MSIIKIHSYLVHPEKSVKNPSPIRGTTIPHNGEMFKMLQSIYTNAPKECKYDIAFLPENGSQKNTCRDSIISFIKDQTLETGKQFAIKLQSITTKRSGLGLLFILYGQERGYKRFVLSRFPADNGILAEEDKGSLSVVFIERIFMKNAHAYKSAYYDGESFDADFWKGKAIDKQINSDITISDYWIKEFLLSDFAVTGERGTRCFALAIREAVNTTKDLSIKEELTALSILSKSMNNKVSSISGIVSDLGLSEGAIDSIKKQVNHRQYDEHFLFLSEEFDKHIKFKSIELDNGALLTAAADNFNDIFKHIKEKNNMDTFSTTGVIINEKIRKTKL